MTLQEAKDLQIKVIYENNEYLTISSGFEFNGLNFSLSKENQIKTSNLLQLPEDEFPFDIRATNEKILQITNENKKEFYLSSINGVTNWDKSGNELISEIEAMTKIDEVLNFSDNRL